MLIYVTNFDFSLFEILEKISLCQFFLSVKILKPLKCIIFFDSDLVYDVILIVHSLRFRFILEFIEVDPLILEIWRSEKKKFHNFWRWLYIYRNNFWWWRCHSNRFEWKSNPIRSCCVATSFRRCIRAFKKAHDPFPKTRYWFKFGGDWLYNMPKRIAKFHWRKLWTKIKNVFRNSQTRKSAK